VASELHPRMSPDPCASPTLPCLSVLKICTHTPRKPSASIANRGLRTEAERTLSTADAIVCKLFSPSSTGADGNPEFFVDDIDDINHSHRTAAFSRKPFYTGTHPFANTENMRKLRQEQANKELKRSMTAAMGRLMKLVRLEADGTNAADALMKMSQVDRFSRMVISNELIHAQFRKGVEAYLKDGKEQSDRDIKMIYRYTKPLSTFPAEHGWDTTPFFKMDATEYEENMQEVGDAFRTIADSLIQTYRSR
jgi:hypothetical protein